MRLKNLTQIWVAVPNTVKIDGEQYVEWTYKNTYYLNLQQDINELDRNSAGEIDYTITKGRTDQILDIDKGDGIYFNNISLSNPVPVPDLEVLNEPKIGKTTLYTFAKYNGILTPPPSL
jgi:hypothetical protein